MRKNESHAVKSYVMKASNSSKQTKHSKKQTMKIRDMEEKTEAECVLKTPQ